MSDEKQPDSQPDIRQEYKDALEDSTPAVHWDLKWIHGTEIPLREDGTIDFECLSGGYLAEGGLASIDSIYWNRLPSIYKRP